MLQILKNFILYAIVIILRKMTEESIFGFFELTSLAEFDNNLLPTNGDVLGHLFYLTKDVKLSIEKSFVFTIQKIMKLWNETGIPIKSKSFCLKKN